MKYLFSLLLILSLCTCGLAQPLLELKPGTTDSARWKITYTMNGAPQVATEPYDTLPNVIQYGEELYRSGGFIGSRRIASQNDFITEEVKTFVFTQGPAISDDRSAIAGNMIAYGKYPITKDTLTSYPLIGLYLINGASCGHPADTMEISKSTFDAEIVVWHPKGDNTDAQSVLLLGDGSISVASDVFAEQVTVIRESPGVWRGANNCVWRKIED